MRRSAMRSTLAALLALVGLMAACSSHDSDRDRRTTTHDPAPYGEPTTRDDRDSWNRLHSDPVCGMTVNPKEARRKEVYEGTTYYFDSKECHRKFRDNPQA